MAAGRVKFAAKHAGNFGDAAFRRRLSQVCARSIARGFLANDVLTGGSCSDLGQVGDAKNLMTRTKFLHFCSYHGPDFPADIGVDLVEY